MSKATRVYSTPPTNTSALTHHSRRSILAGAATALATAAVPSAAPAMPAAADTPDRRAAHAYAAWLHMERRILCGELWPSMGDAAEKWVYFDNAGAGWHFRGDEDWRALPQPSTRAAAVLDVVGVDWRNGDRDCGLNHEDAGERPPLPAGWPRVDGELIALGAQFEPLVEKYYAAHRVWSQALGQAHREHEEKFGKPAERGYRDTPEIVAAFTEACARTGAGVWQEMKPIANAINALLVTSIEGLRVKALVTFWEVSPLCAGDTEFHFEDAFPFQQLFRAVAEVCGITNKIKATGYEMPPIFDADDNADDEEEV